MVDGHHLLYVLSMWVPLYIVTGSDVRLISLMGTPVGDGVTNALLLEWAGIRVLGASGYKANRNIFIQSTCHYSQLTSCWEAEG